MNKYASKLILLAVALVTVAMLMQGIVPAKAAPVTVTWFVGIGTGGDPAQKAAQDAVVKKFNDSHPDIQLVLNVVDNKVAKDALSTLIASGNPPDIVGPVGVEGSNIYASEWLDLKPLVAKTNYNLAQFPENVVNI